MKSSIGKLGVVLILLAFLGIGLSYTFLIRVQRAKMATQCAVLSSAIAHEAGEAKRAGKPFDLDQFLAHYPDGNLFHRDASQRLLDSWGHPLVIEHTEQGGQVVGRVTSIGRDGRRGTGDDHSREFTYERLPSLTQ